MNLAFSPSTNVDISTSIPKNLTKNYLQTFDTTGFSKKTVKGRKVNTPQNLQKTAIFAKKV